MTTTVPDPHVRAEPGTTAAPRVDRGTIALAAVFVLAPVLRMISVIIHPLDTDDAAATLAHIDDVSVRWGLAHLLEPLSTMLMAVVGVGLLRLVPGTGRRVATVGAAMFAVGCAASAMLVYSHGEAYLVLSNANVDVDAAAAIYERFHEGVPLAAPLIPMFTLGALLLAIGLMYGGRVPKMAAIVFALATVLPNAIPQDDSLVPAAIVGSAPMIAATSVFAVALIRQAREGGVAIRSDERPTPSIERTN